MGNLSSFHWHQHRERESDGSSGVHRDCPSQEDVDSRRARCVISWLNEVLIEVTVLSAITRGRERGAELRDNLWIGGGDSYLLFNCFVWP